MRLNKNSTDTVTARNNPPKNQNELKDANILSGAARSLQLQHYAELWMLGALTLKSCFYRILFCQLNAYIFQNILLLES